MRQPAKKILRRGLAALVLALALTLGAVPSVSAAAVYTDVPADHWAAGEIAAATEAGIFQGVGSHTFGLGQTMTRAQFFTAVVRLFGWEEETPDTPTFSDVSPDKWYYAAAETAYANGALPSYATTFRPSDPITREEMASSLVRSLGYVSLAGALSGEESYFTDVTSNAGYIAVARDLGLMKGCGNRTFLPKGVAKREEAAAVLARLLAKREAAVVRVEDDGSRPVVTVPAPEASPDTPIPATPLEPVEALYMALRQQKEAGADLSELAVSFASGGIATVTRGSEIQSSRAISRREVEGYLSRAGVKTYYSAAYQCAYLVYPSGSTTTTVWYQTEESVRAKLALCRLFGVTHYIWEA